MDTVPPPTSPPGTKKGTYRMYKLIPYIDHMHVYMPYIDPMHVYMPYIDPMHVYMPYIYPMHVYMQCVLIVWTAQRTITVTRGIHSSPAMVALSASTAHAM